MDHYQRIYGWITLKVLYLVTIMRQKDSADFLSSESQCIIVLNDSSLFVLYHMYVIQRNKCLN